MQPQIAIYVVDPVTAVHCPDERPRIECVERGSKRGEVAKKGAADHGHRNAALCERKTKMICGPRIVTLTSQCVASQQKTVMAACGRAPQF